MSYLHCIYATAVLFLAFAGHSYPHFHVSKPQTSLSLIVNAKSEELLQKAASEMARLSPIRVLQHSRYELLGHSQVTWLEIPAFFSQSDQDLKSFMNELEEYLESTFASGVPRLRLQVKAPTEEEVSSLKKAYGAKRRRYERNQNASYKEMCALEMMKLKLLQVERQWRLAHELEQKIARQGVPASAQEQIKVLLTMTKLATHLQPLVDAWERRLNEQ